MTAMKTLTIDSREARLPSRAKEALVEGTPVMINYYGHTTGVVVPIEAFELVAPFLELVQNGGTVPAEMLLTEGQLKLAQMLAEDDEMTEAEEEQLNEYLEHLGS